MAKTNPGFDALPTVAKSLIAVGLVLFIAGVYFGAVHRGLRQDIQAAHTAHTKLTEDLRNASQQHQRYLTVVQQNAAREALDQDNQRVLPRDAEIASFLEDINRIAELSGLSIRLIEPRPEQIDELYVKIPVRVRVAGRFHQIARFFHQASHLDRIIGMENIELSQPRRNDADEILLTANVLATTYRRLSQKDTDPAQANANANLNALDALGAAQ